MQYAERPEVLLLNLSYQPLFDMTYAPLIDILDRSAQLKRAESPERALSYLENNKPKAIIVTDEGLTEVGNASVLAKVVSYARSGGLVIIGLHFPCFANDEGFRLVFKDGFGLPWMPGEYHQGDFQFNPACSLPTTTLEAKLPRSYRMRVLNVKDAMPHERSFIPVLTAQTQPPILPPAEFDQSQAPVAGAKVGNGFLAYIGDLNAAPGSDDIVLALCGL
jgi:hypothetical protein